MQSIEYVSVEEVIRPKTLLSLEVRVNSVDHVSLFFAPVETTRSLTPPGDYSVATATKSENKSGFVKEFLSDHPDGNVDAVNKAWAAAGMNGAIGATLIYKTRSEMGLSGNLREVEAQDSRQGKACYKNTRGGQQSRQDYVCQGVPERPSAR